MDHNLLIVDNVKVQHHYATKVPHHFYDLVYYFSKNKTLLHIKLDICECITWFVKSL